MRRLQIWLVIAVSMTLACDLSQISQLIPLKNTGAGAPISSKSSNLPQAEVTFRVLIPANTPLDQPVFLNIMEEVTGLALSAQTTAMQIQDNRHYALTVSFPVGTVIKYRYSRQAPAVPLQEHTSDGRQVRYRLFLVEGQAIVEDTISRWTDTEFADPTGRISGQVLDSSNSQPIPNLLITAGGSQTFTSSDGSFLIEGLPPGTHNLVAYSLDGSYRVFQQGATVAADSTTPAQIYLTPAPMVDLIFVVKVPQNTIPAVPIRLAGNLYQLGNTFADLSGGVNTIAARMPALTVLPDGRYSQNITLPAGSDVHYLYSLGDGIWNTELSADGEPQLRQIIVPEAPTTVEDTVVSWGTENFAPITFDVTVPEYTPQDDFVSLQFKPIYGWTEPIPMWRLGSNRWGYILNGPQNLIGEMNYRICRNDQCGSADDIETTGNQSSGLPVSSSLFVQTIVETVDNWAWLTPDEYDIPIAPDDISKREDFIAGVELLPAYHPSWPSLMPKTLSDIQQVSGNWLVFSPTWSFTRNSPPVLEPDTGQDALWQDMSQMVKASQDQGFNIAIQPTPHFPGPSAEWWASGARDFSWWQVWFERYRNFALNYADFAARTNARSLILGGDWIAPAMPDGILADGSPSGVPKDSETRWRLLLQEVRNRYKGPVFWALTNSQATNNPPAFLEFVDGIYLLWSEPLVGVDNFNPSREELQSSAAKLLDKGLLPFKDQFKKPIILAVAYPSVEGAASGCLLDEGGNCQNANLLSYPNPDNPSIQIDLMEQADLHYAMLAAVNQRAWISGYVAKGYYPPAILQDKSNSIHGKPAEEVIASWFYQWSEEEETP